MQLAIARLERKVVETIHVALNEGDQFYFFTDGYTDQFGGENVKKFNRQRFRNLLLSLNDMPMNKQKKNLVFPSIIGRINKSKWMIFV